MATGSIYFSRELKVSEAEKMASIANGSYDFSGMEAQIDPNPPKNVEQITANIVENLKSFGIRAHGVIEVTDETRSFKLVSLGQFIRKLDIASGKFSAVRPTPSN